MKGDFLWCAYTAPPSLLARQCRRLMLRKWIGIIKAIAPPRAADKLREVSALSENGGSCHSVGRAGDVAPRAPRGGNLRPMGAVESIGDGGGDRCGERHLRRLRPRPPSPPPSAPTRGSPSAATSPTRPARIEDALECGEWRRRRLRRHLPCLRPAPPAPRNGEDTAGWPPRPPLQR
jgi:hypothetical protein